MSDLDDFPQPTGNGSEDLERIRQWAERHNRVFTNFPEDRYTDEAGVAWTRPTAYAYAMVCKANERRRAEIEELRTRLAARAKPNLLDQLEHAYHALRSYQYGNSATDPAKDAADNLGAILSMCGRHPFDQPQSRSRDTRQT